jgi:hypothetical protein
MSIIVPPEIQRIIAASANSAAIQRAAAHVVQGSAPGPALPPKFASLVGQQDARTADGFTAGLTGELAMGAEFGGRRRPAKTYMTHRKGTTFSVRRRTTMQFLPHNTRGYALTPAMRRSMAGIRQRIVDAVVRAVT